MNRLLITAWIFALTASGIMAQAISPHQAWIEGPQSVLLLDEERARLSAAPTRAAAEELAAVLWLRRDPDLSTPANEFLIDLTARVRAADGQFSEEGTLGAFTDRGRALLLFGAPAGRQRVSIVDYLQSLYHDRPSGGSHPALGMGQDDEPLVGGTRHVHGLVASDWYEDVAGAATFNEANDPSRVTMRHGVRFDLDIGVAELWVFSPEQLRQRLGDAAPSEPVTLVFFDHHGKGRFKLETSLRKGDAAEELIAAAPAALISHPEIWELPER
jgi:GWxTD domain-containing protein